MSKHTAILSILGLEHSGTTLLLRILNNHPDAIAIGGMKNLSDFAQGRRSCSCGRGYGDCSWWNQVEGRLRETGSSIGDTSAALMQRKASPIHALLTTVAGISGKALVIESSRQPGYLDLLPGEPQFSQVAVHIFKHPAAQAWSAFRAGRSVLREMRHYRRRSFAIVARLQGHQMAIHLSHEAFCETPAHYLQRILALAGTDPSPGQLDHWGEKDLHVIGGNRMKKDRSSEIKSNQSWRESLPMIHRLTAQILGRRPYGENMAAARTSES